MRRLQSCTLGLGIVGLLLLRSGGLSWAGPPPNPTPSDPTYLNTAGGTSALGKNTSGEANSAFGYAALTSNTTGSWNTASGGYALTSNTTGSENTAFGDDALYNNTTGGYNTAFGFDALVGNAKGLRNTASGALALYQNTQGNDNTASGYYALYNTAGGANTAFGYKAGQTNTTGTDNTFIGTDANANAGTYTNGTALGHDASLTASNSMVLGNGSISKIYAKVTSITAISDRRRKKDIAALDADLGLDFIAKLKPVSYRFDNGDETERYGFIAQDLEQALPASLYDTVERSEPEHGLALIERQNDTDRTYRVSYGELFAPIVKSIQEQQQEIVAQRHENGDLRHTLEAQAAEIDALRHSMEALRQRVASAP